MVRVVKEYNFAMGIPCFSRLNCKEDGLGIKTAIIVSTSSGSWFAKNREIVIARVIILIPTGKHRPNYFPEIGGCYRAQILLRKRTKRVGNNLKVFYEPYLVPIDFLF